jgi:hypothetical protein
MKSANQRVELKERARRGEAPGRYRSVRFGRATTAALDWELVHKFSVSLWRCSPHGPTAAEANGRKSSVRILKGRAGFWSSFAEATLQNERPSS